MSKYRISLMISFNRSDSEMMFPKNSFLISVGISSSSNRISLAALIAVIGVLSSWATESRKSSFCLSFSIKLVLATCKSSESLLSCLDCSVSFLLRVMFSLDSSKILSTSGKEILSSLVTPSTKILAEAVPILPAKRFSENLIKRESAVSVSSVILYFILKIFSACLVFFSPKNLTRIFSISEIFAFPFQMYAPS